MTDTQLKTIRYNAGLVRNWALVDLCSNALRGDAAARAKVETLLSK